MGQHALLSGFSIGGQRLPGATTGQAWLTEAAREYHGSACVAMVFQYGLAKFTKGCHDLFMVDKSRQGVQLRSMRSSWVSA